MPRPPLPRLTRHLGAIFAGEAVARLAGLVAVVVVARHLGPVALGALAVAQGLVMLAGSVVDGGLTLWGTNALVRRPQDKAPVVRDVVLVQSAAAVLLSALLAITTLMLSDLTATLVLIMLPYLLVQVFNLQYVLQAEELFGVVARARAVGQTATAVGAVAAAALAEDPVLVAASFWAGLVITDLVIIRYVNLPRRFMAGSSVARVSGAVRGGLPFLTGAVAGQFVLAVGPLTIELMSGTAAAGQYSAAFRTFFLLYVLVTLIVPAVYPEMVRRNARATELQSLVGPLTEVVVRGGLTATAIMVATADRITVVLFGSAFADAAAVLTILAFVVPVVYFNALASRTLMATGQQRVLAKVNLMSALLCLLAYPGLVWWAEERGGALAFLFITLMQAALMVVPLRRAGVRKPLSPLSVTYLGVPLGSLLFLQQRAPDAGLWVTAGVWLGSVLLLEAVTGLGTWRQARAVSRSLDTVI